METKVEQPSKDQAKQAVLANLMQMHKLSGDVRAGLAAINGWAEQTVVVKDLKKFETAVMNMAADIARWPV